MRLEYTFLHIINIMQEEGWAEKRTLGDACVDLMGPTRKQSQTICYSSKIMHPVIVCPELVYGTFWKRSTNFVAIKFARLYPTWAFMGRSGEPWLHEIFSIYIYQWVVGSYRDDMAQYLFRGFLTVYHIEVLDFDEPKETLHDIRLQPMNFYALMYNTWHTLVMIMVRIAVSL